MTHSRLLISFLAGSIITGAIASCGYGPKLADFPSSSGPEGATVRVTVPGVAYFCELLETRADGLLILSMARYQSSNRETTEARETRIRLVPLARVESVQLQRGQNTHGPKWAPSDPGSRERLRLISRFPQGLTPELLQQLLKMYGQTEPAGGTP
jgi:hypothetical protein